MEDAMFLKLIGMIVLGLLSAVLSLYNKNYYVRVFNDILGRDEDEDVAARVGRGFFYGFFFPIFFALLLMGVLALIMFLIVAGVIAAIMFVLVWVTEKILPSEWLGRFCLDLFEKFGLKPPASCCGCGTDHAGPCAEGESTPSSAHKL
jgi:hypothetical protein